jgi:predicted MPP superfamily phosphohydrolase
MAAVGIDGLLLEPMRPRIVRKDISLKRWPGRMDGFTIALLTDLHYDPVFSIHPIQSAVDIVNRLQPDLVALTGDFVTSSFLGDRRKAAADAEPCAELLRRLQAPCGRWAVMGNHDVSVGVRSVTGALQHAGINVLSNGAVPIERSGGRFWLAGVKDVMRSNPDVSTALHQVSPGEPVVLLAHEPDYADFVQGFPVDLQLSGHSHGGQIRFPLIRPLYLPEMARKYFLGLYKIGNLILYTSPGVGTIGVPVRLNCPPEVTLLTLRGG